MNSLGSTEHSALKAPSLESRWEGRGQCDRLYNSPAKMSRSSTLELVNTLPYRAEGTLQI